MTDPQKLINLYLDNQLTPEQAQEIQTRIKEDDAFVRLFAQYGLLNICIRNECLEKAHQASHDLDIPAPSEACTKVNGSDTGQATTESVMESGEPDAEKVHQIKTQAERQLHAFLAEQAEMNRVPTSRPRASFNLYAACQRWATKLDILLNRVVAIGVRTAICGVFVLVVLGGIHYWHTHRVVATLGDSAHAVWRVPREDPELRRGSMTLEQGYAQLTFKQGTKVLIQAPCTFELQSINKMTLENGSMTATIPPRAVGFTVDTPWTTVVDYGTEFGLSTGQTNGAELHVFKGSVGVGDATASRVTEEGQAAQVDQAGRIGLESLDDRPNLFVRHMPKAGSCFGIPGKRLDLADVVGGGNGFGTGEPGRALDPSKNKSHLSSRAAILRSPLNNSGYRAGSGFFGIETLPFIDGTFVPNGRDPSTTISSTGLLFRDCPDTHGTYYDGIVCGAVFDDRYVHAGRLAGHRYKTPEQPSIGACANVGITFDLDRIRVSMSGSVISRFQAHCGISETLAEIQNEEDYAQVKVTFWVLVDGRVAYSQELGAVPFGSDRIDVPLNSDDRFLTLITTTPQENLYCWSMFAEPALELERE
jgi:hypothetical protein